MLSWFKNYLIIVTSEQKAAPTTASSATSAAAARVHSVTIYDVHTKIIAFSGSFSDVQHIVAEFACIFVIQGDGKVCDCIALSLS
jgi:hypothetical protein